MPQGLRNMLILGQLRIAERHKTKHGHVYSRRDFKNHQCERCGAGLILPGAGVAEPEPVELKLFWDLEPEPKINFNKHFLQSVWRMLK